jgi:hypothetical protein
MDFSGVVFSETQKLSGHEKRPERLAPALFFKPLVRYLFKALGA